MLLKMPIVPNSLKEREGGFTGQFQDPITDEIIPLYLHHDNDPDSPSFTASIPGRARTYASNDEDNNFQWQADDSHTYANYRNRGYMTALYNALAHAIDRYYNAGLYPNDIQSDDGYNFWRNKASANGPWPVREAME